MMRYAGQRAHAPCSICDQASLPDVRAPCFLVVLSVSLTVCVPWQVARSEYVLLWLTFLSVIYSDLQSGILAGILYSVVFFAYRYSQARSSQLLKPGRRRHAADIPGACAAVCFQVHTQHNVEICSIYCF